MAYPNRDSTPDQERYSIPAAQTIIRGTLRYQGFPQFIMVLVVFGFLEETSLDVLTRTAIVWMESRKVGQYDARELSVRWPGRAAPAAAEGAADAQPAVVPPRRGSFFNRPKVELLWDSPAAVGHNRQIVMRAPLATEGDRVAVLALDAALKQIV